MALFIISHGPRDVRSPSSGSSENPSRQVESMLDSNGGDFVLARYGEEMAANKDPSSSEPSSLSTT